MAGIELDRLDNMCALCRKKVADEVGSHLAPNFIIHKAFSFDGKGGRDREISTFEAVHEEGRPIYYGRNVSPDAIDADHGGELSEDEIEENNNFFVRDHLFCKECEKRFGILESAYRDFYSNPQIRISPRLAYLFWMSVFWRMSVGFMAILLWTEEELELRKILDSEIKGKSEIENSNSHLGDFGYVIWQTKGIKKGYSGIYGTHTCESPYTIILNDLIIMLFANISEVEFPLEYAGLKIDSEMINTWDKSKVIVNPIDLEDFAKVKRYIEDQTLLEGWGYHTELTLQRLLEEDRHNGEPYSNPLFEKQIEVAEIADLKEERCNKYKFLFRYFRIMELVELKRRAAEELGVEYNELEDETLLLYDWDIENYKKDCARLIKTGYDTFKIPMATYWFLSNKQKKDKVKMKRLNKKWDKRFKSIKNNGFTLNDILCDNLRSKGN